MTVQKTIEWFEKAIDVYEIFPIENDFKLESFKVAVAALEKQIPKKPTKLTNVLLIDAGWIYKCPTCGLACGENKYHLEVTQDEFYCTQCGQMLDWD